MPFIIIIFIAMVYLLISIKPDSPIQELDEYSSGTFVSQGDKTSSFLANIRIIPPGLNDSGQRVNLTLTTLSYSTETINSLAKTVCVDEIVILLWGETQLFGNDELITFPNRWSDPVELCKTLNNQKSLFSQSYVTDVYNSSISPKVSDAFTINPWMTNYRFYYPYDWFEYSLIMLLRYRLFDNHGELFDSGIILPEIDIYSEGTYEWMSKKTNITPDFSSAYEYLNQPGYYDYFEFIHQDTYSPPLILNYRPVILRVIYSIFVISLIIFIGFLASTHSIGMFIEGAIGVLFGIYGFRQIMYPEDISVRTVVDVAIMGLYIIFFVAVVIQFIRYARSQLTNPDSKTNKTNSRSLSVNAHQISLDTPAEDKRKIDNPLFRSCFIWGITIGIIIYAIKNTNKKISQVKK
jgi:hypothetical protein